MSGSDVNRALVLNELKKNRLRNSRVIEDLKRELEELRHTQAQSQHQANAQPPTIGYPQNPLLAVYPQSLPLLGHVPPPLREQNPAVPLLLPYESNSLASEANLMKMDYISSGGSDPVIIRQLNDLIAQAVTAHQFHDPLSNQMTGTRRNHDQITLKILEDYKKENERLKSELENFKSEKMSSEDELSLLRKEHILKMTAMKQELEQLQQAVKIKQLKDQVIGTSPPPTENPSHHMSKVNFNKETPFLLSSSAYPLSDSLHIAPYDPATGFMIFHDFVLSVDPSFKSLKVIARLMRGNLELGSPVPLPERHCLGMHGDSYCSTYLHCLIGIKQPVTKCLPSPDLCLLIEVQAVPHYEDQFKPVSWAKFLLFDDQHRVLSGRWKVPLRVIPARPDLHPRETNNIPQCGKMEYHYRICNARDSEVQTKVSAAPNQSYQYIYPPTSFDDVVHVQGSVPQKPKPKPIPVASEIRYVPKSTSK